MHSWSGRSLDRRGFLSAAVAAVGLTCVRGDAFDTAERDPLFAQDDLAANELERAGRKGQLCSKGVNAGVGLRGEYFSHESFGGELLLSRTDTTVDFETGLEWPTDRAARLARSVRWTGWVRPPMSGVYRFHLGTDHPHAQALVTGRDTSRDGIELAAGRYYPVRLEVARLVSAAAPRFEWTAPHGARYLVPRASLFLPSETVAAATSSTR
ncbi:MAG: PA14 domain-containing protein [Rhizobacter sp.]